MNFELVSEWYHKEGASISEIARRCGVSQPTVRSFMIKHGIDRRTHAEQSRKTNASRVGSRRKSLQGSHDILSDREWLTSRWLNDNASIQEIARQAKCSETVVRRWLAHHQLPATATRRRYLVDAIVTMYSEGHTLSECADAHGVSLATASRLTAGVVVKRPSNSYDRTITKVSVGHQEVANFVSSILNGREVRINDRQALGNGMELDIFVPSAAFGIEYNGIFFHSERGGNKGRMYHKYMTDCATAAGIDLLHIFEDDWHGKRMVVESMIRHRLGQTSRRVFARKCHVAVSDPDSRRRFFNANHLQGDSPATVAYELRDENDATLACMSFRRPRFTDKWEWELIRYACALNTAVVGGFSKLLHHFCSVHRPQSIVSYSDASYSDGGVYRNNGFVLDGTNAPSYAYVWKGRRVPRTTFTKRALLAKFGGDPHATETQIARAAGLDRVWNCGTARWVWRPSG